MQKGQACFDKLFINGRIETLDQNQTVCQAVGVSGDRIATLGSERELSKLAGSGVEMVDLEGGVLFPGLIDSHTHLMIYAYLLDGVDLAPPRVKKIEDIVISIKRAVEKHQPGEWIRGSRFVEYSLSENRYGKDNPPRRIPFDEQKPLWISPVWALGSLIGRSFIETGWPTRFTDWQTIRLEDLPLNTQDPKKPLPIEANFDRDRIDQFIRSGIIPLAAVQGKDIAVVPDETTAGSISLRYQLFVSRITQLVLWCRDDFEKGIKGTDLEAALQQAFKLFWEISGHSGPESLEILAGNPDPDGRVPVRIALEPTRQILASRDKVELDFSW